MNTTEHVLLIILASALALFLVLAITIAIMIIVLISRIRAIIARAESIVDAASEISQTLRKTVGSFTFFSAMRGVFDAATKLKKSKERD